MSVIETTGRRLTGRDRAGTLAAASVGFSMVQLDVFVVNVAIRQIGSALGGGTSRLQWVVGIYTLMFAALILTAGALGDRFGARRMFTAGHGSHRGARRRPGCPTPAWAMNLPIAWSAWPATRRAVSRVTSKSA
jgi:MFS family permease